MEEAITAQQATVKNTDSDQRPMSIPDTYITAEGWQASPIPTLLENVPEETIVSEQLRRILIWSLQRRATTKAAERGDPGSTQDNQAPSLVQTSIELQPTEQETDRPRNDTSDLASLRSSIPSHRTLRLRSRLKQLRQDVAVKVASKSQKTTASQNVNVTVQRIVARGECISCFDDFDRTELIRLSCSHDYCKACLKEVVLNAVSTESAFPPKCCLTEIPLSTLLACLDTKQREDYKEKAAEYAIPAGHRWYCPEPKCSKWIKPEKLHRKRRSHQTCPHCSTKICSMCRSLAHDQSQDCPQDFGLESTLEVAEAEGWRRCYSCRTMVELTIGCRHITCKCGAEFCYVCNARWRTCSCTESDKDRRLQELRTLRQQREQQDREEQQRQEEEDATARAEAAEFAEVLRQIEAFEQEEAARRAEEERIARLEEELALARLEEERLLEEIARRDAEEEAERQLQQILLDSSKEECDNMSRSLQEIVDFQKQSLTSTHGMAEQTLMQDQHQQTAAVIAENATLLSWLKENVAKRQRRIRQRHSEDWQKLTQQTEEMEDEMFMQMTMYLRDKPNREQREKKMRDTFTKQQVEKQEELTARHATELKQFERTSEYEFAGLRLASDTKKTALKDEFEVAYVQLGKRIGCERKWLEIISARRTAMLQKHKQLVIEQVEAGHEPVGLVEELTQHIEPLPLETAAEGENHDQERKNHVTGISELEDSTTPVQRPQALETADLYGPSTDFLDAPAVESQAAYMQARVEANIAQKLPRKTIPGTFPSMEAGPSNARPPLIVPSTTVSSRKSSKSSSGAAISMAGMTAMSFMVPTRPPIPISNASSSDSEPSTSQRSSTATNESTSTSATSPSIASLAPNPADQLRGASTALTLSRTDSIVLHRGLLETVAAETLANRTSFQQETEAAEKANKSKKTSKFGGMFRRKELSEDEIRRKMARLGAGDGAGRGAAW